MLASQASHYGAGVRTFIQYGAPLYARARCSGPPAPFERCGSPPGAPGQKWSLVGGDLQGKAPRYGLGKVIDDLKSASNRSSPLRLGEDIIATTVCRHAVKANDPLRYLEVEKLIQDLLACDLPYCCPHGRPTMIQISHAELEKKFGRKV